MDPDSRSDELQPLERDGAVHCPSALGATDLAALIDILSTVPAEQAGVRLAGLDGLSSFLLAPGSIGSAVADVQGAGARPVRAVLFDKTAGMNWPGDMWLYSTPIVHASNALVAPTRRRVLQVDYAAEDLPGGLKWLGL